MKTFGYFLLFLGLMSCTSDFLDQALLGKPGASDDPNYAQNLVIGAYHGLLLGEAFGPEGDVHGIAFVSATNIRSDDADKGSTPSDQAGTVGPLDLFTLSPSNVLVQALWAGHYNGIAKCNQALLALTNAPLSKEEKNQLQGEVKCLRAYYYFNLLRYFGPVPLVVRVPAGAQDANTDPSFQTRASLSDLYAFLVTELKQSLDWMGTRSQVAKGRANKGWAQALLAKVYLYQKDYTSCLAICQALIQSQQYQLLKDYAQIWREKGNNSSESIIELQSGIFNNSDYGINAYSMFQGPRVGGKGGWTDLGWGFGTPSESLVQAFEPGDVRKAASIIFIDQSVKHLGTYLFDGFRIPSADSVENARYNYKAYHSENPQVESWLGNRDRKQKNVHLLRFAEVLLMQAEAANALGKTDLALESLNQVRQRAGLAPRLGLDQIQTKEAIWQERRVELALEHDRFFELVRTGRAATVMQAHGKNFKAGVHELLPIPALQIALSAGKLSQNPGY